MKNTTAKCASTQLFLTFTLLMGLFLPFSPLNAQSYNTPVFERRENGALYLLPSHPWGEDFGRSSGGSSVATGGLNIFCSPSAISANVGQTVTWFSSISGGSGTYLYSWSGTEGLSGNNGAVSKIYTTRGEKSAILTVTTGNRQVVVNCGSTIIGGSAYNPFTYQTGGFGASCYAAKENALPGESVSWVSIVSGVTASTTYSWDGADGLTGDRPIASKVYATNGNKFAVLTVADGINRIVATCTNFVEVGKTTPVASTKPTVPLSVSEKPTALDIQGLCAPSSAKATRSDSVEWHAVAIGGTGMYRFSWFGDDALSGEGATTSIKYETAGRKRASVFISSGDKTKTVPCYSIEITKIGSKLSIETLFSWIKGPLGFTLAALFLIIFAVLLARRKHSKEEVEEERDHVA